MGEMVGPFRARDAIVQGTVTEHYVRRKCTRVLPGVYVRRGTELTAVRSAYAVALWSQGRFVLSGHTAAALWGAKWIGPADRPACNARSKICAPDGVDVYYERLAGEDVGSMLDNQVTLPVRTSFDLARRLPRLRAVAAVDAMYQTKLVTKDHLREYARSRNGARGIRRVREVIELSDEGAESPQETRTRVAVIDAGLPRPAAQRYITDSRGVVIGRVDLCWEEWRVIVEYDGDGHCTREQLARDIKRYNAFADAGWAVIRVKSDMLREGAPRRALMAQIRRALRKGGAPL
ncbi:DUF559 domain-containing protein [Tomitella fengzijianii]|uniref:DUF559 domain-containing protein n=1 Tax=Tomitella fengzijianii TaxID=2597660 RepID=A0A516WZG0_9ACTN|nr:DUF559 domain-containing protein [Tomitella fengzijianii]QDQ96213.1 DUF559 domain-containing protein [Tomitella fengzijianii]